VFHSTCQSAQKHCSAGNRQPDMSGLKITVEPDLTVFQNL
jgi:hypothetical protein